MLTRNDETNRQQRGGRPEVIATLLDFGKRDRRHGANICLTDNPARRCRQKRVRTQCLRAGRDRMIGNRLVADEMVRSSQAAPCIQTAEIP